MPRRKMAKVEREVVLQGQRTFGLWLRARRIARGFTQAQAAAAVGVSERQWIRYEQGSKVLSKRFPAIAIGLNVPETRIMYLTGHPISSKKNDAMVRLRRIHAFLIAGNLEVALEDFFLLYDSLRPPKDKPNSDIDGLTPPNFANAVAFLDELPMWLFKMVLVCMQTRVKAETK